MQLFSEACAEIVKNVQHTYHVPSPPQYVHVPEPGPTVVKPVLWPGGDGQAPRNHTSLLQTRMQLKALLVRWLCRKACLFQCRNHLRPGSANTFLPRGSGHAPCVCAVRSSTSRSPTRCMSPAPATLAVNRAGLNWLETVKQVEQIP